MYAPLPTARHRVLSGMRPTGRLHLGNYTGALRNWVELQGRRTEAGEPAFECFFFIADWHALTTDYADLSRLKQNVYDVALDFLSAGLDPERSTIFVQSHVPQHAELNLLLSMITPLSWLERVPSYKDQQEQLREKDLATYGFLGYPLLQSADILLYSPPAASAEADRFGQAVLSPRKLFVPVGADQVAHVEITREVARRFNFLYGRKADSLTRSLEASRTNEDKIDGLIDVPLVDADVLPEPEVLLTPTPKLPGTDGRKMSKSYNNAILLSDSPLDVLKKTHDMTNGGQRPTQRDPGDPEICPVGDLHRVFSQPAVDLSIREGCRGATISCEQCKYLAGTSINEHLGPIRLRRERLDADPDQVWDALERGRERAAQASGATMRVLREVTGLSRDRSGVRVAGLRDSLGEQRDPRDLDEFASWWQLAPAALNRNLRELWTETIRPVTVELKPSGEGVWTTRNHRRVLVAAAVEDDIGDRWTFAVKPKSYEVLVLLCWGVDHRLHDLVVAQKLFLTPWTAMKKLARKGDLSFTVTRSGEVFTMLLPLADPIDLSGLEANYEPLST